MCLFVRVVDNAAHLGSQILQSTYFRVVNRYFQAKHAKYNMQHIKNLQVIKIAASIPTKLCIMIKITKYSSWVVPMYVR